MLFIQLLKMLIYISLGIYLSKTRKIKENTTEALSVIIVSVTTPCTILSAFIDTTLKVSVAEIGQTILAALIMFICLAVFGKTTGWMLKISKDKVGIWEFLLLFSNNIFIGFPIIETILGHAGIVYATIICIPCNALIFSYGIYLIGKESHDYRFQFREICNICTVTSLLCLVIVFFPINVPNFMSDIVMNFGKMSTPLALLVMGMEIAESFRFGAFKEKNNYIFCILRLIVAPILAWFILSLLPMKNEYIRGALVITAALPASNMAIVLSRRYQAHSEFATNYVTFSTIMFSIGTLVVCLLTFI